MIKINDHSLKASLDIAKQYIVFPQSDLDNTIAQHPLLKDI